MDMAPGDTGTLIERQLTRLHAPLATVHPYTLLEEHRDVVMAPTRRNGLAYALTYRNLTGVRVGHTRWGGRIWNRNTLEIIR